MCLHGACGGAGRVKRRLPERQALQSVKKHIFDRLAEVKGAVKTSKPISSAYIGTVESGLRSKSKCLAQQGFTSPIQTQFPLVLWRCVRESRQLSKSAF